MKFSPNGLRMQKATSGVTIDYLVDSLSGYGDVIAEYENGTKAKIYTLGDDLISQAQGNAAFYYGYDGLGSTRMLFADTGAVSDSYDYTAFGEIHGQSGSTDNTFLFTGEQYDSNVGQYYLRARYYNQAVGRFTQMDTYQGRISDPASLHKYLYTENDPINMVDPTGHMSIGSFGAAGNIMGSLSSMAVRSFGTRAAGSYIGRTFVAIIRYAGIQAIRHELKRCVKSRGKKCRLTMPIIVAGNDFPNQRQHIWDAVTGQGENFTQRRITPLLHYQKGVINRASWPRRLFPGGPSAGSPAGFPACTKADKERASSAFGGSVECDEYPFNASKEGGYKNYKKHRVSARYIPKIENRGFGATLQLATSKMKRKDRYLVAPVSYSPVSFFIPFR